LYKKLDSTGLFTIKEHLNNIRYLSLSNMLLAKKVEIGKNRFIFSKEIILKKKCI